MKSNKLEIPLLRLKINIVRKKKIGGCRWISSWKLFNKSSLREIS